MKNVLLLIDREFEDMEAMYPYYRMLEAGHKVNIVAYSPGIYKGKHGYPIMANKTPFDIKLDDIDAVIIPGGRAPDAMRIKPEMVELVRKAHEKGKLIATICHGPQMLIEADIVRGKRLTGYKSVRKDITNAGGEYLDREVVEDGNLITSRTPEDLPAFCRTIIDRLGQANQ